MWSKIFKSQLGFFVYGIILGIILYSIFQSQNTRFVSSFQRTSQAYSATPVNTTKAKQALNSINQLTPLVKRFSWFDKLDELLLVKITDADNAPYTILIKGGNVTVTPGWTDSVKATLVLENIRSAHLVRLQQVLGDGKLDESEMFEIANVFLVPGLQALYNSDVLYLPGDKRIMQLDNFIQVELVNKYGARDLEGNPITSRATVVNVDGYWLVFPGWQGQSDVRYTVDVNQMIHYYYLINYKFKGQSASDLVSRKELLDEYMQLRQATLTYSSHK